MLKYANKNIIMIDFKGFFPANKPKYKPKKNFGQNQHLKFPPIYLRNHSGISVAVWNGAFYGQRNGRFATKQ